MVEGLIHFLDAYNELVQLFRTIRDKCRELDIPEFKIHLYNGQGARCYEFPTSNTLEEMVFESGITSNTDFNVNIQHKDGPIQRVNKLHPSYMSLQFPFLFIYGQSGYHINLMLRSANGRGRARRVILLTYYIYQLHFRLKRKKQNDIRADYLSGLYDVISRGERDGYEIGGRIILPMSFTGGPRYIFMAQYPNLSASDRADVVCRGFEQKIQSFDTFLKEERIFENVTGVLYTFEF
ncbi:hypothetical protein Tco_1154962 [Tanacetum coccineum]